MKPWRWNNFHFAFVEADLSETVPFIPLYRRRFRAPAGGQVWTSKVQTLQRLVSGLSAGSHMKFGCSELPIMKQGGVLHACPTSRLPGARFQSGDCSGLCWLRKASLQLTPGMVLLHVWSLLNKVISTILHARKQSKDPRSRDPLFLHPSLDFCSILLPMDFPSLATLAICLSRRLVIPWKLLFQGMHFQNFCTCLLRVRLNINRQGFTVYCTGGGGSLEIPCDVEGIQC